MGRQQGIAGHLGAHLAIAQDKVRQHSEHGLARRTLETPDGKTTQPDPDVMRVARQAAAPVTGRLMPQLKAQGEDESDHQFDKGVGKEKRQISDHRLQAIDFLMKCCKAVSRLSIVLLREVLGISIEKSIASPHNCHFS
jgi:hypothetical protein